MFFREESEVVTSASLFLLSLQLHALCVPSPSLESERHGSQLANSGGKEMQLVLAFLSLNVLSDWHVPLAGTIDLTSVISGLLAPSLEL